MNQEEFPLDDEDAVIQILQDTLAKVIQDQYSHDHIVHIITIYLFSNEYYLRRDGHLINLFDQTITIHLFRSKYFRNLYTLSCPIIFSRDFLEYSSSNPFTSSPSPSHRNDRISAWIDTECKDDHFTHSRSANMMEGSYFLMITYHRDGSRTHNTPWIAQWRYDHISMPFVQMISRIISYPSDWNYVTLSYGHKRVHSPSLNLSKSSKSTLSLNDTDSMTSDVSAIFYTATQQHVVELIPIDHYPQNIESTESLLIYRERVTVTQFANGFNYPWLMFGSAVTRTISHHELCTLFNGEGISGTEGVESLSTLLSSSKYLKQPIKRWKARNVESTYFVTRSCQHFEEMKDHGAFWTTARDHISILEIAECGSYSSSKVVTESGSNDNVEFNVIAQIPVIVEVDKVQNGNYSMNVLDVTVTREWTVQFQRKYGVKKEDLAFMVLYTLICHDLDTVELYAAYLMVRNDKVRVLRKCKMEESQCLTKFLVGKGMHQTMRNEWICMLIGIDENHREIRYQLRLSEEFELLNHHKVKGNEHVCEVTNRYKCKALKYFVRAEEEEKQLYKVDGTSPITTTEMMWGQIQQITNSPHLILATMAAAYVGYRVSRAVFGNLGVGIRFRLF